MKYGNWGQFTSSFRVWPRSEVPVEIHHSVGSRAKRAILSAIQAFEKETCIRFVKYKRSSHRNYVQITATYDGCFSELGMVGGRQLLNLEPGEHCEATSTVIHEFMHAVGIYHEHER